MQNTSNAAETTKLQETIAELHDQLAEARAANKIERVNVTDETAIADAVEKATREARSEHEANIAALQQELDDAKANASLQSPDVALQRTQSIALAVADNEGYSVAGGGETVAAIDRFSVGDKISYISTGGGAFLEFVQGRELPAVKILEE